MLIKDYLLTLRIYISNFVGKKVSYNFFKYYMILFSILSFVYCKRYLYYFIPTVCIKCYHLGEREQCTLCEKTLADKDSLRKHMRSIHKDVYNDGFAITPKSEMTEGGMIYNGEQVTYPNKDGAQTNASNIR